MTASASAFIITNWPRIRGSAFLSFFSRDRLRCLNGIPYTLLRAGISMVAVLYFQSISMIKSPAPTDVLSVSDEPVVVASPMPLVKHAKPAAMCKTAFPLGGIPIVRISKALSVAGAGAVALLYSLTYLTAALVL